VHDRAGRILAAIDEQPQGPHALTVGIAPRAGQHLLDFVVPSEHRHLPLNQLFARLRVARGKVVLGAEPLAAAQTPRRTTRRRAAQRPSRRR
jgi:hypothetical protein